MICFNADARHAGKLVSTVLSLRAAARSQAVTIAALWSLCISNKKQIAHRSAGCGHITHIDK
nr:MAG TPA: hypothetical protein [Caudoviricetes sp.]DAQ39870.1 MAG TPA: hypothetical protein [Bacteriophage sp.]DAL55479.1 MAG TPA_asm: hypothetical protein [Caudoviricetes sp.]DAM82778.1 MAG TPA: hypothetical protein [Caudoviricetes sp.]DAP13520.1 MAG TPA: hypothetical protein [Caudoviricetes sp.]